jgi:hypothetical protein
MTPSCDICGTVHRCEACGVPVDCSAGGTILHGGYQLVRFATGVTAVSSDQFLAAWCKRHGPVEAPSYVEANPA